MQQMLAMQIKTPVETIPEWTTVPSSNDTFVSPYAASPVPGVPPSGPPPSAAAPYQGEGLGYPASGSMGSHLQAGSGGQTSELLQNIRSLHEVLSLLALQRNCSNKICVSSFRGRRRLFSVRII
jgi:hypothetical protein